MKERKILLKILTYVILIAAAVLVAGTFITATSYAQLAVAILLYPLLVFFAFNTFPRKRSLPAKKQAGSSHSVKATPIETFKKESLGISDIDKRVFLKLIGGAGVTLFLFSIFNKKAEGMFFKNMPAIESITLQDSNGKKIDPAQNQPTDGYKISEISEEETVTYYGFTNKDGAWFVMKEDATTGSFRYVKGDLNFPVGWKGRKDLAYDYFSNVF